MKEKSSSSPVPIEQIRKSNQMYMQTKQSKYCLGCQHYHAIEAYYKNKIGKNNLIDGRGLNNKNTYCNQGVFS